MKKIFIIILILLLPNTAFGAIAVDAVYGSVYAPGPQLSVTFSFTTTGSNRILFVSAIGFGGADRITATYNGVAMTEATKSTYANGFQAFLLYQANPPSGAHDVVIYSSTSARIDYEAVSYTGVEQTSPIDSVANAIANSNIHFTATTTVVSTNCWIVGSFRNNQSATVTMDTGSYRRDDGSGATLQIDSNGIVGTGNIALGGTVVSAAAAWAGAIASFKEPSALTGIQNEDIIIFE